MFTLRRISSVGVEINQVIGSSYTLIDRVRNPEEFRRTFKEHFDKKHVADLDETSDKETKNCYAFVCNGEFIQPLFKNQMNYIMTSGGTTFDNITYK